MTPPNLKRDPKGSVELGIDFDFWPVIPLETTRKRARHNRLPTLAKRFPAGFDGVQVALGRVR